MSFADRITRAPRPYEPDRAAEAVALFHDLPPELHALVAGAAGCAPYLADLMAKETAWITAAFEAPEAALEDLLGAIPALAPDQLSAGLRQAKRRVALLAGLADLGGVWRLEEVTSALTRLGDAAADAALRASVAAEARRGKLPGHSEDSAHESAGHIVALAMGKMGAHELNYSSDIDLICLFDETRYDEDDYLDARAALIRATRKMAGLLNDNTAEGYVFRTDLRLRPDPAVTPVCVPMAGAESYYESMGRTWERAAYIKARPAAGDLPAGAQFLRTLTPFVWRKHLDFAAIQDAHDMRLRIREHKALGGEITLPGHDMKLGRGGIREIEFFTQTRQLISGGRDPQLRCRGTVDGLAALAAKGWIAEDLAETLTGHYRFHREVEHRLQMIRDAQTQTLPGSDDGFERLAAFMGRDRAGLEAELRARLEEVHDATEGFFAPDAAAAPPDAPALDPKITEAWHSYPALRSARAVELFDRIQPKLMAALAASDHPQDALAQFDVFLKGLPAGVQLFSLFEANPQLLQLIVDICAISPALASYLGRNAGVLDAVIGGAFFEAWPGRDALHQHFAHALEAAPDYEARLDTLRREMKERHFQIGVHMLRGLIDADTAGHQYCDLAEAVLKALLPHVIAEFARKHGPPPGRGLTVLGMGSLGAGRLHAQSDLDLIVIYDPQGAESSDGPRPLATRPYYARLTQALITALKAPMAEGTLYEADMRLRPSGRQGPVATSLGGFRDYQRNEAWTWEHLALTRARAIAGDASLGADVEAFRLELIAEANTREDVAQDLAQMRARIAEAKASRGVFDAKIGAGHLQDVELFGQSLALRSGAAERDLAGQIGAGCAAGLISAADAETLATAGRFFWHVQVASRLLADGVLRTDDLGPGGARLLIGDTGADHLNALADLSARTAREADAVIHAHLPTPEARDAQPS